MAALGDVSTQIDVAGIDYSMETLVPSWPDVSIALPDASSTPPSTGGFSGYFSFA